MPPLSINNYSLSPPHTAKQTMIFFFVFRIGRSSIYVDKQFEVINKYLYLSPVSDSLLNIYYLNHTILYYKIQFYILLNYET